GSALLDCIDYWRNRISEAGNVNREGYTITDLDKGDDGSVPKSIYGGFPYSVAGLDNKPGQILELGTTTGIYYNADTGRSYFIRTAAQDSFGCKDTFPQKIYVTAIRAKFRLGDTRPNCATIVDLIDSSYIQDPCINDLGAPCDRIVKWTVYWGDKSINSVNSFFNTLPSKIAHDYTRNGLFKIYWKVETELGCVGWDSTELYIPGPEPMFDTLIPLKYCVNDKVYFKNLSKYTKRDSSIWSWEFGDGVYNTQKDTITSTNDTMSHKYSAPGKYKVTLYHYFKFTQNGTTRTCRVQYPDSSFGETPFYVEIFAYDTSKVMNDTTVCIGDTVNLRGYVKPYGRYSNYVWNFGKNITDTLVTADTFQKVTYMTKGKYFVTFYGDKSSVSSPDKICPAIDTVVINVAYVVADFDIDSTKKPIICFSNTSENSVNNRWGFFYTEDLMSIQPVTNRIFVADNNTDGFNDPSFCRDFRDSLGSYWVCLEATNDIGCKDTICKQIFNNFKVIVRPPNVFTPNGTGTDVDDEGLVGNEVFNILIEGEEKYELVIFDRWGVKVFESNDKNKDWNGKVNNSGAICPDGTYYYILTYRFKGMDKDEDKLNGIVRIIR
ncbi:MAG: gliding motility-associated C-terminal domain-containing protein, partial [Bacteroidia bacterium]|nr:gliding motility-associated C-terminal domain-containing protein [Bacteroidia bacterium]